MANNRVINADLDSGLLLELKESLPVKSIKRDQYGNVLPQLDIISAKNVMPSRHGYTSFFGTDDLVMNEETVLNDIQDVISYRTVFGETVLLALCADGVYLRCLAGDDLTAAVVETATEVTITAVAGKCSWKKGCYSEVPSTNRWKLWSVVILENKLYLYQKGMDYIAYFHSTEPGIYVFEKLSPSYIVSTVPAGYSYIVDMVQEWGNSTYKALNAELGTSPVYINSSSDAALVTEDLIANFNTVNDGYTTVEATSNNVVTTDLTAAIKVQTIAADFSFTRLDGSPLGFATVTVEEILIFAMGSKATLISVEALALDLDSSNNIVIAVNSTEGVTLAMLDTDFAVTWITNVSGISAYRMIVDSTDIYLCGQSLADTYQVIDKFDLTGTRVWETQLTSSIATSNNYALFDLVSHGTEILVYGSELLSGSFGRTVIHRIDKTTGARVFTKTYRNTYGVPFISPGAILSDGTNIYFTGSSQDAALNRVGFLCRTLIDFLVLSLEVTGSFGSGRQFNTVQLFYDSGNIYQVLSTGFDVYDTDGVHISNMTLAIGYGQCLTMAIDSVTGDRYLIGYLLDGALKFSVQISKLTSTNTLVWQRLISHTTDNLTANIGRVQSGANGALIISTFEGVILSISKDGGPLGDYLIDTNYSITDSPVPLSSVIPTVTAESVISATSTAWPTVGGTDPITVPTLVWEDI